ncbi:MAG: HEAT repeat domain-containing protein [Isosphaeraceae bacterium]
MVIAFTCGNCGKEFQTDASLAGKKCKCKQCGHIFVIPGGSPAPAPARPAPVRSADPPSRPGAAASRPTAAPSRPAAKPAKPSRPNYLDDDDDPYAIDDPAPVAARKPAGFVDDDDDEFLGPRPVPSAKPAKAKKKRTSSGSDYEIFDALPGKVILYLFGGIVALVVWSFIHSSGAVMLVGYTVLVGVGLLLYGNLGAIVRPFQESVACGLMCLFLPIYPLYYLISRWDRMRGPFLNSVTGVGFILAMALLLPAVQSSRNAADRAAGRRGAPTEADGPLIGAPEPGQDPAQLAAEELRNAMAQAAAGNPPPPAIPGPELPPGVQFPPRPGPIGPRFIPPPPVMQGQPKDDETVTLVVTGLADRESETAFNDKLNALLQKLYGGYNNFATGGLARKTIKVSPVPDAQALADQIDFARVISVADRTITLQAKPLSAAERRPPDHDFVAQVLFDLKSPVLQKRKDALSRLSNAPPDEKRRVEVAKAVESMLKDPDGFARSDAAKALAIWGGPANTPSLVEALRDPAFNVRWAVFDAIAAMKDPAAAEPVAAYLATNDRSKAVEALKGMGSGAESAVIKYLEHGEVFTRMEAARILAVIGTEKSVGPLQLLIQRTNNHGLDAMAAGDALDQLGAPRFAAPSRKKSNLVPRSRRN